MPRNCNRLRPVGCVPAGREGNEGGLAMKTIPNHIIVRYDQEPNILLCERCGQNRVIRLPAEIEDFILQARAFAESHKDCQERKENHD